MSTSDKLNNNKFISRRNRQSTITLFNELPNEVDKKKVYHKVVLTGVSVNESHGIMLGQRGIDSSYNCKLIIDMRDIKKGFSSEWFLQAGKDFFVIGTIKEPIANPTKKDILNLGHKCFEIGELIYKTNVRNEIDIIEVLAS